MSGEPPIVLRVSLFTVEYWDVIQTSVLDAPVRQKSLLSPWSLYKSSQGFPEEE